MRRSLGLTAGLVLTGMALALSACGSGDDEAGSPSETTATDPSTTEPVTTEPVTTEPVTTETMTTEPPSTDPPVDTGAPSTTAAPAESSTTTPPATAPSTSSDVPEPAGPFPSSIDQIIDEGVTMNLAHAGGDQAAPHSTMFAFSEAVAAGANALEMDVQLTGDGVLIVQHDDTVDKTTDTTGPVLGFTLSEIQALDNAYWFSPQCWPCQDRPLDEYIYRGVRTGDVAPPDGYVPDDFRVPTFREVAERFPDMVLDVEIKGTFPDAVPVAEVLAAEIADLGRTDSVVVVSFDDQLVDAFRQLAPDVAVSPGLGALTDWFLNGAELDPEFRILQLPPFQGDIEVINAEVVQRIHDEGRIVWVWPDDASTQENAEFYEQLLAFGVDGIITGRPGEFPSS